MTTDIITRFDYTALSPEIRVSLKARAEKIGERNRRMASDIWENGRDLHEAQQELAVNGYGRFQAWVENETPYSLRTAYRFIDVYQQLDYAKLAQSNIAASALYLLAAPSTPDEARQELIEAAEQGQAVTYSQAKEAIEAARPENSEDFHKRLRDGLHSMIGAAERWERRREVGRTDAELMEAIAYEFGRGGGSSGPDLTPIHHKGGANPQFTYGGRTDDPQTALKGAKLRDLVRELLEIPYPEDSSQPTYAPIPKLESLIYGRLPYATGGHDKAEWLAEMAHVKQGGKGGEGYVHLAAHIEETATFRKGDLWQAVNNVHDQLTQQLRHGEEQAAALEATAPAAPYEARQSTRIIAGGFDETAEAPSPTRNGRWWEDEPDDRVVEVHEIRRRIEALMIAADGKKEMGFIGPLAKASLELDKAAAFLRKQIAEAATA